MTPPGLVEVPQPDDEELFAEVPQPDEETEDEETDEETDEEVYIAPGFLLPARKVSVGALRDGVITQK